MGVGGYATLLTIGYLGSDVSLRTGFDHSNIIRFHYDQILVRILSVHNEYLLKRETIISRLFTVLYFWLDMLYDNRFVT
jgi:hypothetical protein